MYQTFAGVICIISLLELAVLGGVQSVNPLTTETDNDAFGLTAERFLLKGSIFVESDGRSMIYRRPGGRYTAYLDFYSLKPTKLVHLNAVAETEIYGRVGKRVISLTIGKGIWAQIALMMRKPGNDPERNFDTKAFWYMGTNFDGYSDT